MKQILIVLILLGLPGISRAQDTDTSLRQWSDSSGQHLLVAKLVSYDPQTKQVILEKENQDTVKLDATGLSMPDRRYLAARAERLRIHKNRQVASPPEHGSNAIDQALAGNANQAGDTKISVPRGQVLSRYGIDWHRNPESAAVAARGKVTDRDDRPIIWFRVLGDLTGFM